MSGEAGLSKVLVRNILEHALDYEWSIQGLGMLRLYLGDGMRMHVWDGDHARRNVTTLHDHPWSFESYIVAGRVEQYRYVAVEQAGERYMAQAIVCGEGGGVCEPPTEVRLARQGLESYGEGETYTQAASEIHESLPYDGTVTIIDRTVALGDNPDIAHVFYPVGEKWVSAEPRNASYEEVIAITNKSLDLWF